jgi:predicted RNase H-like nuclease (RuvC/YqgF family)
MSKASGALEELRNNNSELNAQLEQKNQEINKIKDQLRKVESRYRSN